MEQAAEPVVEQAAEPAVELGPRLAAPSTQVWVWTPSGRSLGVAVADLARTTVGGLKALAAVEHARAAPAAPPLEPALLRLIFAGRALDDLACAAVLCLLIRRVVWCIKRQSRPG